MATPSIPPSIPEEGEQLDVSGGRRATRNINRGMADGQGKSPLGKSPLGKSPNGKSPQGKSPNGKSPQGKSPQGKSPQGKSPQGKSHQTLDVSPRPGSQASGGGGDLLQVTSARRSRTPQSGRASKLSTPTATTPRRSVLQGGLSRRSSAMSSSTVSGSRRPSWMIQRVEDDDGPEDVETSSWKIEEETVVEGNIFKSMATLVGPYEQLI